MKNTVIEGMRLTPAFQAALAEQRSEPDAEPPLMEEPPLRQTSGIGCISFQADKALSKKITGNGIGGHDRIVWDRHFADQIREARDKFYELLKLGFKAHLVREDGKPCNRVLEKFDPNAEEIVMIAPVRGG